MLNVLLYMGATLIWGSTWLAIKLQLTQVPPILSVGYRFCLAALILFGYCLVRRRGHHPGSGMALFEGWLRRQLEPSDSADLGSRTR